jgi:hypothetical protein
MAATASVYEASSHVMGAEGKGPPDPRRIINISDQWGRVEIARLCAAAVYADWTSTLDFVKRVGAPFWKMLCLLATRFARRSRSESASWPRPLFLAENRGKYRFKIIITTVMYYELFYILLLFCSIYLMNI